MLLDYQAKNGNNWHHPDSWHFYFYAQGFFNLFLKVYG